MRQPRRRRRAAVSIGYIYSFRGRSPRETTQQPTPSPRHPPGCRPPAMVASRRPRRAETLPRKGREGACVRRGVLQRPARPAGGTRCTGSPGGCGCGGSSMSVSPPSPPPLLLFLLLLLLLRRIWRSHGSGGVRAARRPPPPPRRRPAAKSVPATSPLASGRLLDCCAMAPPLQWAAISFSGNDLDAAAVRRSFNIVPPSEEVGASARAANCQLLLVLSTRLRCRSAAPAEAALGARRGPPTPLKANMAGSLKASERRTSVAGTAEGGRERG